MGVILFNGKSSLDYRIQVEHPPVYVYPEKDYTTLHVLGRNGDLIVDNGSYQNVSQPYDIAFDAPGEKYAEYASGVLNWLHSGSGYCRLEDSYDTEIYRMAYYKESGQLENLFNGAGRTTINFICKPQRFLKSGELEQLIRGTFAGDGAGGRNFTFSFLNITSFEAKPKIVLPWIVSDGSLKIIVGNDILAINFTQTEPFSYNAIVIDYDLQCVWALNQTTGAMLSINNLVSGAWGKFLSGETKVVVNYKSGERITNFVYITPRWWKL